jgi:hypothetical protein
VSRVVSPPEPIQYRRISLPLSPTTWESSTPPQRSITAADPTLSSSQVTSARVAPWVAAMASDWRRIEVA